MAKQGTAHEGLIWGICKMPSSPQNSPTLSITNTTTLFGEKVIIPSFGRFTAFPILTKKRAEPTGMTRLSTVQPTTPWPHHCDPHQTIPLGDTRTAKFYPGLLRALISTTVVIDVEKQARATSDDLTQWLDSPCYSPTSKGTWQSVSKGRHPSLWGNYALSHSSVRRFSSGILHLKARHWTQRRSLPHMEREKLV